MIWNGIFYPSYKNVIVVSNDHGLNILFINLFSLEKKKKENTRESAFLSLQQSFLGAIKNFVEEKLSLRNTSGSLVMV